MREAKPSSAKGGSRPKLGLEVWGLALLTCSIVIGLVAWQAARDKAVLLEQERDSLSRLAQLTALETGDMIGQIQSFFHMADLWLERHPDADPRVDPSFVKLVDIFRDAAGRRVDIRLVSAEGGLFYIPSKTMKPLTDVSDRGYYRAQTSPATRGFVIADPVKSRVTGQWGIPISYPLSTRNAGIAIIFASIELRELDALYEPIRPKPGGSVALARRDSVLLARSPPAEEYIGKPLAGASAEAWWRAIADTKTGVWRLGGSLGDTDEKLLAYAEVEPFGLAVSISARVADVLAPWKASLWWRALLAALMALAIVMSSSRLVAVWGKLDAAQGELRANVERLERSDATKDKLFSVIAHDLRGPVGGMCNLLETLSRDRRGMDEASVDEIVAALRLASWNTYQLLENLLAWSRSQRGEMRFAPERAALRPLVEECEEVYALSTADKGITLEVDVDPGLEAFADPELLKVVLRNLISNAVKFARRGGRVRVSAERAPGGIELEVEDDGIGMGEAELGALFDPGSTRSRSGTANERGSGLGLALAKEIVDLHGGAIEVRSADGAGSAFSVFLPDGPGPGSAPRSGAA